MAAYIDLSEKHGHRNDHGFACGAEFNVKIRRRINIPDFVREKLSQGEIDEIWWEEAGRSRDALKDALSRRYKWIGELAFVGRGPGWLAIEDTECSRLTGQLAVKGKSRNWDTIGKVVDQHLKSFIKSMEAPSFWRDVAGVASEEAPTRHHATRKTSPAQLHRETKKSPAQLQREIDEVLAKSGKASSTAPATNIVPSASQARFQIQTRAPGGEWEIHSGVSAIKLARQWARETAARGRETRLVDRRSDKVIGF